MKIGRPRLFALLSLLVAFNVVMSAGVSAQTLYGFDLDEGQEVPPSGSAADGRCIASLNPTETELSVTCLHTVSATAAHIHNAPAGMNGPVVFPFVVANSPFRGVWSMTPSNVTALRAGELYVNIHSAGFPGGEIRGQIGAVATSPFAFSVEGSQEVPPSGSLAEGSCVAVLDDSETEFTIGCSHTVVDATAGHVHAAPPGSNGGVVFPFSSVDSPFMETWAIDAMNLADLLVGDLYVNIHSISFPGGEIRGQITPAAEVVFGDGFETGDLSRW